VCGDVGLVPLTGGRRRPLESKLVLFLALVERAGDNVKREATEFRAELGVAEDDAEELVAGAYILSTPGRGLLRRRGRRDRGPVSLAAALAFRAAWASPTRVGRDGEGGEFL
jgi:hypothetical protein